MGYNNNADEKLLLSKAYDAVEISERSGRPRFLGFLNEHEQAFLKDNISQKRGVEFFGGYDNAVRLMMGAGAENSDFPITALEITYKPEFELRHRDFLGSLMGLGLRRDAVGDILCGRGRTVIFVRDDIVDYVLSQVEKIGRVGVKVGYADTNDLPAVDDYEEIGYTVSSLRLDAFVAAAAGTSRDKAARMIRSELVAVDHITTTDVSKQLKEGATVTIRKYGKFVLTAIPGATKKGRLRITVKRFR